MLKIFKVIKTNKEMSSEFRSKLILENSKRFSFLLKLIIASQVIFVLIELFNIIPWESSVFATRVIIIFICTIFITLMHVFGKKNKKPPLALCRLTVIIQVLSVLVGCYFVTYMFSNGIYSFSVFLLAAFVFSLTSIYNPYYAGIILGVFFIGLIIYLTIIYQPALIWFGELLIAFVFVCLIYVGNILNYNRHLRLFLQDYKIILMNKKLMTMSETDALTGIYNRRKILEIVENNMNLSNRYDNDFCIAILDIDHFKKVNDNYGHNVGDSVLQDFSNNIKLTLRSTDILGRWGGEEFLVVLQNSNENDSYLLVERLREKIEQYDFPNAGHVTFSSGICMYNSEESASKLINKADSALYIAKEKGRNQTQIHPQTTSGLSK